MRRTRQGELLQKFPLEPLKTFEEKDMTTDGTFAKIPRILFALIHQTDFAAMFALTRRGNEFAAGEQLKISRRLNTADLQANYRNLWLAPPVIRDNRPPRHYAPFCFARRRKLMQTR